MSLPSAFAGVLRRDLAVAYRRRSDLFNPPLFFVIVVVLFPLAMEPDSTLLRSVAAGVVWVAALLATLLALDGLFRTDFEDGTLEQLALSPHPLAVLVLAKVAAHWLLTGVPLILVSPVLAAMLALPSEGYPVLALSLTLGTPTLSLIGAVGVALTVGVRRGGVLVSLLVLPLYVPVLVFGAGAVANAAAGVPVAGQLYVLAALLALSATLTPVACAAALRISLD